ncbi:MAG TPA: hypothetical protein VFA02_03400 [Pseudacidobacterium sp.]|nr:hypothetical protein [Pseudacidobacterium sp.]
MKRFCNKVIAMMFALFLGAACAQAQYGPPPPPPPPRPAHPPMIFLGMAHVDGLTDHDDIKVGPYAGRYHSIVLRVRYAPIQFEQVVIHYGNGTAQTLPVKAFVRAGGQSNPVVLPGGDRVIASLELWYSRANPNNPNRPEVRLFGMP